MPFDVRDFPGAPPEDRAAGRRNRTLVATWLFIVAGMVLVMIVLGGVTRLTGSGLSIMEWAPISGALPPMSEAEWQRLYHLYQQVPQYALVNAGIGLDGFKHIFWLEWIHRLWGRLIGLAFVAPLVWFWATGRIERRLMPFLAVLFVLGGLQGVVGWIMVASGFAPAKTAVSPYDLVAHLTLALGLYAAILWTALIVLRSAPPSLLARRLQHGVSWLCAGLVAVTILAGGFVAGIHAGFDYNTFPLMDGSWVPRDYTKLQPFVRNLTENIATVQFDHRLLASLTVLAISSMLIIGFTTKPPFAMRLALLAMLGIAMLQYILGVMTLVFVVPIPLAALHQIVAVLLLTAAIVLLYLTRPIADVPPRR